MDGLPPSAVDGLPAGAPDIDESEITASIYTLALNVKWIPTGKTSKPEQALVWVGPSPAPVLPLPSWLPADMCHTQNPAVTAAAVEDLEAVVAAAGDQLGWTWLANVGKSCRSWEVGRHPSTEAPAV